MTEAAPVCRAASSFPHCSLWMERCFSILHTGPFSCSGEGFLFFFFFYRNVRLDQATTAEGGGSCGPVSQTCTDRTHWGRRCRANIQSPNTPRSQRHKSANTVKLLHNAAIHTPTQEQMNYLHSDVRSRSDHQDHCEVQSPTQQHM